MAGSVIDIWVPPCPERPVSAPSVIDLDTTPRRRPTTTTECAPVLFEGDFEYETGRGIIRIAPDRDTVSLTNKTAPYVSGLFYCRGFNELVIRKGYHFFQYLARGSIWRAAFPDLGLCFTIDSWAYRTTLTKTQPAQCEI